jgi:hypothetical protein
MAHSNRVGKQDCVILTRTSMRSAAGEAMRAGLDHKDHVLLSGDSPFIEGLYVWPDEANVDVEVPVDGGREIVRKKVPCTRALHLVSLSNNLKVQGVCLASIVDEKGNATDKFGKLLEAIYEKMATAYFEKLLE